MRWRPEPSRGGLAQAWSRSRQEIGGCLVLAFDGARQHEGCRERQQQCQSSSHVPPYSANGQAVSYPRRHSFVPVPGTGTFRRSASRYGKWPRYVTVSYPCLAPVRFRRSVALGQFVLGTAAAFWRGQPAAFRGDRAALDAVRRRHGDAGFRRLVDLGRAHSLPEPCDVLRDVTLDHDVVRLVVARLVPRREDGRELVERELAVRRRIALRAVGSDQIDAGIPFELEVSRREAALRRRHRPPEGAADEEAAAGGRTPLVHFVEGLADET